jgi:hypothetical protein
MNHLLSEKETIMTTTMSPDNTKARKTLSSQLDRLDAMLDGLAEGLNEAVADAVQSAVAQAVKEAVQATLAEVLTNPTLLAGLRPPPAHESAAPPCPRPARPGVWERLGRLWRGVCCCLAGLRAACGAGLRHAGGWLAGLWRRMKQGLAALGEGCRSLGCFRYQLLAALGIGGAVAAGAWFAGPWLAALLSGVGGFAAALAVQAWLWLRRALGLAVEPDA